MKVSVLSRSRSRCRGRDRHVALHIHVCTRIIMAHGFQGTLCQNIRRHNSCVGCFCVLSPEGGAFKGVVLNAADPGSYDIDRLPKQREPL